MPNRYLRQSFIESERVSDLPWFEQCLWTRLLVTVDDFGRLEANPKLLRPKLFPLHLDSVREADIQRGLAACEEAGLVRLYMFDGRYYLQMEKWERGRAKESKYPDPPPDNGKCEHLQTCANKCLQVSTDENISPDTDYDSDTDTDTPKPPRGAGELPRSKYPESFEAFWEAYPRKVGKAAALRSYQRAIKKTDQSTLLAAIEAQKQGEQWKKQNGEFIPNPSTWLNQGRWEDEVAPTANDENRYGDQW